jgi:peptide/nickel transport system substrate-binding protein
MRNSRRTFGVLIAVLLIASACQPASTPTPSGTAQGSAAASQVRWGGTLAYGENQDLPECNPTISSQQVSYHNVFDGLARYNAKNELKPELAESWTIAPDGLTMTFKLRKGVKWHDGQPFTSADVKFTYEKGLMVKHPTGVIANKSITGIETPDESTVIFKHSYQNPSFLYQIGIAESYIIPKHIYEKEDIATGPHATCKALPIGTGAFKATEYKQGDRLVMERNPDWWGTSIGTWNTEKGAPYLDKIIVAFVPDATARANGFESGQFDFLFLGSINAQDVARFQQQTGRTIDFNCIGGNPPQNLFYINLRDKAKPWAADVRVRQAIAWALDRKVMNERGSYGLGVPSHTWALPENPELNPNVETYGPRNVAKANDLLDQAGFRKAANGMRFQMRTLTEPFFQDYASTMKQQLSEVGIDVAVEVLPRAALIDKGFVKFDYDTMWGGLGVRDPAIGVARLYRSDNIGPGSFNNASAYANPEMDKLWDQYARTIDPEARKQVAWKIQEMVLRDLPTITVVLNRLYAAQNTSKFGGFANDCASYQYSLLRTVYSKTGSPNPPSR